jgi:hypothetical protein
MGEGGEGVGVALSSDFEGCASDDLNLSSIAIAVTGQGVQLVH